MRRVPLVGDAHHGARGFLDFSSAASRPVQREDARSSAQNSAQASHLGADGCILRAKGIFRMKEFLDIECGSYLLSASPSRKEARHGANLA